jgi:RNA:NAD 2'-phosphotransferase (TPT1/KptA family)
VRTAQFLGFVLRHQPKATGFALDDAKGWASVGKITAGLARPGRGGSSPALRTA